MKWRISASLCGEWTRRAKLTDVGRIWVFRGCGISWVCCSSSSEKTRALFRSSGLAFLFRETRVSLLLVFPRDSCPSSFFRGNSCPPPSPLRPPRTKLTVLLHTIGNLALCRFYSKTIALRTPVSFIFLLQIADMYIYARNQSHGGRTF